MPTFLHNGRKPLIPLPRATRKARRGEAELAAHRESHPEFLTKVQADQGGGRRRVRTTHTGYWYRDKTFAGR
jgi:hypothetical protein